MNSDDLHQIWQTQPSLTRLTTDPDLFLEELRRNQRSFAAIIFWRDVREVGTSLLLVPLWIYLGARLSLPWTWYLMVPSLVGVAGFMLVDRSRHKRQPPELGEPLRRSVENSMAQVEHQIWLLRHIFWWYLLPPGLAGLAFLGQVAWQMRSGGWWMALGVSPIVVLGGVVAGGIYWLNQSAVRSELEPRRRELAAVLNSLKDETSATVIS